MDVEPCQCGVVEPLPWSGGRLRKCLLSAGFGALVIATGLIFLAFAHLRLIGAIMLAIWVMATVAATLVVRRRGHRGSCLIKRSLWFGVFALGAPVHFAITLP